MKQCEYFYAVPFSMQIRYSFTKLPFIHRTIFTKLVIPICIISIWMRKQYKKRVSHSRSLLQRRVHNLWTMLHIVRIACRTFCAATHFTFPFFDEYCISCAPSNGNKSNAFRSMKTTHIFFLIFVLFLFSFELSITFFLWMNLNVKLCLDGR